VILLDGLATAPDPAAQPDISRDAREAHHNQRRHQQIQHISSRCLCSLNRAISDFEPKIRDGFLPRSIKTTIGRPSARPDSELPNRLKDTQRDRGALIEIKDFSMPAMFYAHQTRSAGFGRTDIFMDLLCWSAVIHLET
jgi:hypothetical protein